ncbi:STAS domain-containing protein [Streptomyces roseolus]|uniref:STAS domain-containing protein n=1 Tax=Streptomyces roseolus TaxID=67358 RepID=UPI00227D7C17|nr:STAS domain-containing protein [Streptomyces roseolus]
MSTRVPDQPNAGPTGELDVVSAPNAREALNAAVFAHDRVHVDCGGLTFCDCTGLSALLAAALMLSAGSAGNTRA